MKWNWTTEDDGSLTLRDAGHFPRATVQLVKLGYVAIIFESGMPDCGPYKSRPQATAWVEARIAKILDEDIEFGPVPATKGEVCYQKRKAKRKAA